MEKITFEASPAVSEKELVQAVSSVVDLDADELSEYLVSDDNKNALSDGLFELSYFAPEVSGGDWEYYRLPDSDMFSCSVSAGLSNVNLTYYRNFL